jgi:hypothetical protein
VRSFIRASSKRDAGVEKNGISRDRRRSRRRLARGASLEGPARVEVRDRR